MTRVHSIDYLRGLMALAVLFYHFLSWSLGVPDAGTVIGRLGIYAVSTFYIVSGMSMYLAYSDTRWSVRELAVYVCKRYLRLAPAYWLACALMIGLSYLTVAKFQINWHTLWTNLTLTFAFDNPRGYMVTGGWSIGNEMVFYIFFPLVMWLSNWRAHAVIAAVAVSLTLYCYSAFFTMDQSKTLADNWGQYIQPGNQAFLFFLGIAIAWASRRHRLEYFKYHRVLLTISLISFTLYPSTGNQISIVTGHERLIYTALCGIACLALLNIQFQLNATTGRLLNWIGDLSYTIYILHGALAMYTLKLLAPALGITSAKGQLALLLVATLPTLLVFSYKFYTRVEKPIMRAGQRMSTPSRSLQEAGAVR